MRSFGIEIKVIVSIVIFTFIITFIERYEISTSIEEQFISSEKSRANLLLNTLSPIISLNMSLGLVDSNKEYLDEIYTQNKEILILRVKDQNKDVIYNFNVSNKDEPFIKRNFFTRPLIDSVTKDSIGTIELYLSNQRYESIMKRSDKTSIEIFIITLVLLTLFIYFLKIEFRPLKNLAE
jgi:hypothetical protein